MLFDECSYSFVQLFADSLRESMNSETLGEMLGEARVQVAVWSAECSTIWRTKWREMVNGRNGDSKHESKEGKSVNEDREDCGHLVDMKEIYNKTNEEEQKGKINKPWEDCDHFWELPSDDAFSRSSLIIARLLREGITRSLQSSSRIHPLTSIQEIAATRMTMRLVKKRALTATA